MHTKQEMSASGCGAERFTEKAEFERPMKVVLVVPPQENFIEAYSSYKLDKDREVRPHLGILYIASALRETLGLNPVIIDCLAEDLNHKKLEDRLSGENPDVVGVTVSTFNLLDCIEVAESTKKICPDSKVCFGGNHATLYPRETLAIPDVDAVVVGEGEHTFTEFVESIGLGTSLDAVDGLGWKGDDGTVILNRPRKLEDSLDNLPMPAYDLVDLARYTVALSMDSPVAHIQTSRGCPFNCKFCDIRKSGLRSRSPEKVLDELQWIKGLGAKEFFILDDTFTASRKRALELTRMIGKSGLNIPYKISSRVDTVDQELVDSLASSGCYSIHFGVESGSQRNLDNIGKGIRIQQVRDSFAMARAAGIRTFAHMMIGLPGETREEVQQSEQLAKSIGADHANYTICTPLPGTELYRTALKEGLLPTDVWQEFAENPKVSFESPIVNQEMSEAELRLIQDRAIKKFYSSPRVIINELMRVRSLKQLKVKAITALKLFSYRKKV